VTALTSKLKKTARRIMVLMTVGVVAASLSGIAKADPIDANVSVDPSGVVDGQADVTVSVAPLGFWDGPK
jgi:hypothetical protein